MDLLKTIRDQMQIRRREGVLTDRLVQEPGAFGLGKVPRSVKPDATVSSICGYCSTGCSLKVHLRQGEAINLSPSTEYPVNLGMACPKGWEALAPLSAEDRLTRPLLRDTEGKLSGVSWTAAMEAFTTRFKDIQEKHGNQSVAFLSTGQMVTEEMAFLGALAKFGMGIVHGDGNTRQCMATAVVAYKRSFGFDAPPYTYQDFEESDVLVFVGANPCIAHPIMWQRVMSNPHSPEIVVIDPRKTETAMAAARHLPLAPKSDLVLFYALAKQLIDLDLVKREYIEAHTSGYEDFARFLEGFDLDRAARETGLAGEQIQSLARLIGEGKRVSFWWTMGVNQSYEGVRVAQAIINLALMTGNIGRPGTGANSITGQCNAMGSRLFSNTTNLFGGRDFTDPEHRQTVADCLDLPVERIPQEPSWAYDQIIDGIERGEIKGLWVIATNTAHSWINQKRFRRLREKLDFLVVQDMFYTTDSAVLADLVLPAAGWGEKDGTFINSERRIGRTRKVRKAPGHALSDFSIFRLIAHHWGCGEWFREWESPEAAFKILKRLSRGQPCDITGIPDYDFLDAEGGVQWPYPAGSDAPAKHRRLFEDGRFYFPDGAARFEFEAPRGMPEAPDEEFPLILLTGRGSSSQWHTQTRTAKSDVLRKLYPEDVYVEMNTDDPIRRGIAPDEIVAVRSRRGRIPARAVLLKTIQPGQIFIPMHYVETNELTQDSFDPYSRQPSYKACAVEVEAVPFKRQLKS